jgi:hypothetical protein
MIKAVIYSLGGKESLHEARAMVLLMQVLLPILPTDDLNNVCEKQKIYLHVYFTSF